MDEVGATKYRQWMKEQAKFYAALTPVLLAKGAALFGKLKKKGKKGKKSQQVEKKKN